VRDKRSLEFTVNRSLMTLFRTSSVNIVQDCQKFFRSLPISNFIDIRTARFLEDFIVNENYVCRLSVRNAQCIVRIKSFQCIFMIQHRLVIREVLSVICFSDDIIVYVPYDHLVKLIYFILFSCDATDIVK